jgi:hypothetical protein
MLHACFTPIALCFVYTLWRFYAFSGTNLLTRCHSASSLFSAVFVFQKSYTGNILGIGRNEARTSYFSQHETKSQGELEGGQGLPHHLVVRVTPRACHPMVCGPWLPSDVAPPPLKSLHRENPKSISVFPSKVPQRRHRRRPILGEVSVPAPCRDEGSTGSYVVHLSLPWCDLFVTVSFVSSRIGRC